jgi:hypothetical protein
MRIDSEKRTSPENAPLAWNRRHSRGNARTLAQVLPLLCVAHSERVRAAKTESWQRMRDMSARLLEERTGAGVDSWNRRIQNTRFKTEAALRAWLTKQGVIGYAQSLLVMERFGYPDFFLASADELIDAQYADRPEPRPIFDAIIGAAAGLGDVTVQARKTFVSLVTPRRTFARVQPTTKNRVDLALRLSEVMPGERLRPSKIHETMPVQVGLASRDELDSEVVVLLRRAYNENR